MSDESWEIKLATVEQETAAAYRDRDALLALAASVYPAHLCHVEDSWSLVVLELPTGTTEWPVKAENRDLFHFLEPKRTQQLPEWSGHNSEERRAVLMDYVKANIEGRGEPNPHQAPQEPQEPVSAPQEPVKAAAAPKRRGRPRKTAQTPPQAPKEA